MELQDPRMNCFGIFVEDVNDVVSRPPSLTGCPAFAAAACALRGGTHVLCLLIVLYALVVFVGCVPVRICVCAECNPCVDVRVQDDEGNVIVPPPDASAVEGTIGLQKTPRPLQVCEAPLPHTLSRLPFV